MIKAVFFDVDGTLFSHKTKQIPESTKQALKILKEKGIKIILATGRHNLQLNDLNMNDIFFDAYILLTGQLCLDKNKKMIFGNELEDAETLKEIFNRKEIPVQIFEKDSFYINYINDDVKQSLQVLSSPLMNIGTVSNQPIYQAIIYVNQEQEDRVKKHLSHCQIIRTNSNSVDVISITGGKVEGIKRYLELFNIKQSETMAFGDGENDIDMLTFVEIGIAMGNADSSVKECADYITEDIDQDGIYKAVMELLC